MNSWSSNRKLQLPGKWWYSWLFAQEREFSWRYWLFGIYFAWSLINSLIIFSYQTGILLYVNLLYKERELRKWRFDHEEFWVISIYRCGCSGWTESSEIFHVFPESPLFFDVSAWSFNYLQSKTARLIIEIKFMRV